MSDLESLFRWAIYYDYRTTPERILRNLRNRLYGGVNDLHDTSVINVYSRLTDCSAEQISRSHLVLSISEFLGRYKQNIMQEARSRGIDARAVAAAISWEFQENLKGRLTDYAQIFFPGKTSGIGWGSMHTQEAQRLTQSRHSVSEIACIRMDAMTVIPLVAQFMKDCVDLYFKESGGVFIGQDSAVVAYFYNTGLNKVKESASKQRKKLEHLPYSPKAVRLKVLINPMARWVHDNITQFEHFKTEPQWPLKVRTVAVAE
ncbi:MAG: hypothetical protein KDD15_12515 [Lewinella sp.]|nr:hypothetical protein [Lewinella sp.]